MAVDATSSHNAEAGPSTTTASRLTAGASPYHESSQFKHWRFSRRQLAEMRAELNVKSAEVVARNQELEKEAQIALNHTPAPSTPSAAYLSVTDELLLLRFYCIQIASICRKGFGLPEVVEATAISYMKRFYLKNSVMEWHPKTIMPTCLFFAAKTTNYPVLIDQFIPKFSKLQPADVLDTEFLLAQSLSFEFWIRGAEKAVRGWFLEFQDCLTTDIPTLQAALPTALKSLEKSRLTDAEFLYTPSQIGLACWRSAAASSVAKFLDWRYETMPDAYGIERPLLEGILDEIQGEIASVRDVDGDVGKGVDMAAIKGVDKRLRMCTNPEKTPGTALYIKRKQEKEAAEASARAAKSLKSAQSMSDRESVFGDIIQPIPSSAIASASASTSGNALRKPLSPRVTIPANPTSTSAASSTFASAAPSPFSPRAKAQLTSLGTPKSGLSVQSTVRQDENVRAGIHRKEADKAGGGDVEMQESGMGVRDEAMGLISGGTGLREVGKSLGDDD